MSIIKFLFVMVFFHSYGIIDEESYAALFELRAENWLERTITFIENDAPISQDKLVKSISEIMNTKECNSFTLRPLQFQYI